MMRKPGSSIRGFSLIEMLVGLLITSFGLLGLVALQARAMQLSVGSEDAQRATLLASEMATLMFNSNTVDVSPAVVAAWAARVADTSAKGVPNGIGTVTAIDATKARISVTWSLPRSGASAGDTHRYLTDVVIPR